MSVLRSIIEVTTATACRLKRGQRVRVVPDSRDGLVKVNLGCGLAVATGWINVDASLNAMVAGWPRPLHRVLYRLSGANRYYAEDVYCDLLEGHRFVHHDAGQGLPFDDACVDAVYSSHFLEHLYKADGERMLRESLRVLRPGGLIRVCVPDLAHAIEEYHRGHKRPMLENYFFVEDKSSVLARHKYMYDFELLYEALEAAGFVSIVRRSYREGEMPDIDGLDNRPEETLFVEARKPSAGRP